MAHRPKIDNAAKPARSNQNLSCNWTGSADFGRLVPVHWEELVEGDHVIKFRPRIEMQMLPFASPTFSKIDLYCHAFVVPIRQLQRNFYDIWSRTGDYKDSVLQFTTPKGITEMYDVIKQVADTSLERAAFKHWTSLGLNPFFTLNPQTITDTETPIWLAPWLAYNKIWWDFYRDPEVLRDESKSDYIFEADDLTNWGSNFGIKFMLPHVRSIKNCWIADLFSSSGDPYEAYRYDSVFSQFENDSQGNPPDNSIDNGHPPYTSQQENDGNSKLSYHIQMTRLMESLMRLSERLSLSGKRQIEALYARYGVKPKWSEMNLCRYVGGAKSSVMVDNIISSADTSSVGGDPLGHKAGAGYCALSDLNIKVSVEEPSILMVIVSVMPHIHFVQGLSKKFQRKELQDMYQSSLEYVGNVAVAKREVAMKYRDNQSYVPAKDGETFAFSDPYYEYKMGLDILAGDFMKYHGVELPEDPQAKKDIMYMQSMENYIDFPFDRKFNLDNLLVDGDQFNKVFTYLGGSVWEDVDDHFHLSIDKEIVISRPMEGFAIPTLETTKEPHKKTEQLSADKML